MTAPIHRVPAFPSKSRLAAELDMAESTVDEMVKRGVLPPPVRLSTGCVRWCWVEVETALASLKHATSQVRDGHMPPSSDPYLAGAQNVRQLKESERGAT